MMFWPNGSGSFAKRKAIFPAGSGASGAPITRSGGKFGTGGYIS
jgi:hypothetical protein